MSMSGLGGYSSLFYNLIYMARKTLNGNKRLMETVLTKSWSKEGKYHLFIIITDTIAITTTQ